MKKFGILILDYAQVIIAFFLMQYLRIQEIDISVLNELGLLLALTSTACIAAGYINRIAHDWSGFSVVAIMIYALIIVLKSKFFLVGIPAAIGLIAVFYIPSGMNMERLKANRIKAEEEEKNKQNNEVKEIPSETSEKTSKNKKNKKK